MTKTVAAKSFTLYPWTSGVTPRSYPQTSLPMVLNIGGVSYFDAQQMFLNVMKQAGSNSQYSGWATANASGGGTSEESYLSQILDADGYPTTLTLTTPPTGGQLYTQYGGGTFINQLIPSGIPWYPSGNYRFQWQGKGTVVFSADATLPSQTTQSGVTISGNTVTSTNAWGTLNSITVAVTSATSAGMRFNITALPDSSNYLKAMTLVQSSLASSLDAGNIFHPNFLAWLQVAPISILRFMDTLNTNGQVQASKYFAWNFASNPTAGTALPALAAVWPNPSGTYLITLDSTGEQIAVTFTCGSTATSGANPTITCTNAYYWYYGYESYSKRPLPSNFCYTLKGGVPFEVCIALANKIGADAWLNVPMSYSTADWASLASLCVANSGTGRKVYIEWMNEVWNGGFNCYHAVASQSVKLFGGGGDAQSWYGRAVALMADQIATTAGNPGFDNKFIVVMGGQAANTGSAAYALQAPSWTGNTAPWKRVSASGQKTIKAATIAPYFGNGPLLPADFTHLTGQGDGGYTDFLASLTANPVNGYSFTAQGLGGAALPAGGWFAIANGWVAANVTSLAPYGALPIICYEGNWSFTDANNAAGQEAFFAAASIDARMAGLMDANYKAVVTAGASVPSQYNFLNTVGQGYEWGLIKSVMQTLTPITSAPPKFQGFINYLNGL